LLRAGPRAAGPRAALQNARKMMPDCFCFDVRFFLVFSAFFRFAPPTAPIKNNPTPFCRPPARLSAQRAPL
jgi:hypothetical protein